MSTANSNREFLDCVEISQHPRPPKTSIAMTAAQTTSPKGSSLAKANSTVQTSLPSRASTIPPRKMRISTPKNPGTEINSMSKTPPNFDVGRWFVHSVEIPVQSTKAPPRKKISLGGRPEGRHSVASLKSRVKGIFGSDGSSDDENKASRLHRAEKDKPEGEGKKKVPLMNIFDTDDDDDDDLPLKSNEQLPAIPTTNDTVVFATSIFASENRDHDKVQEDSLERTRQRQHSTQRPQPSLKKQQPRLQSNLRRQQSPPKRVARPLSTASATSSSSSGSEDNEDRLVNRSIVEIISSTPRAFKQTQGLKLRKTAKVLDRDRAAPAHVSQPTKILHIVPLATKRSRVRNRIDSSEEDLQSEVKTLTKVTRLPKRRTMPQKSEFARNLEKLKRARLGLSPLLSSSSDSSNGENGDESDNPDSDEDDFNIVRRHRIPNNEDKDFIVEDMDEAEQNFDDIPDEFRLSSHQDLDTDFKIYIQYLLNLSFDPDFERKHKEDNYFKHSVTHVVKTLGSYQTSMTVSQKWSRLFRRQLDNRPFYKKEYIPNMGLPCDACQIVSRPATQRVEIYGEKYDLPKSLRDASHHEDFELSDSDNSSDSSSASDMAESSERKSADFTFNVGKTCCQRSHIYHKLRHWTYHCARNIEKYATEQQRQEVKGNKTQDQPSMAVDTNMLLEKLEQNGVVRKMLSEFKQALNEARDLERSKD